jgi:hypothetical protein
MLRFASLISLLENNSYLRKSLEGLKNDMPDAYDKIKEVYESPDVEAYKLLDLMVNRPGSLDHKYMIWVKNGDLPLILEIKDKYSRTEIDVFSLKTNIPRSDFESIAIATSSFLL